MSAAEALEKKIVFDGDGKPSEVVIPYEQFVDFIEANGLDLSEEDVAGIRRAQSDIKAGNRDAFVSSEEIMRELGCTG